MIKLFINTILSAVISGVAVYYLTTYQASKPFSSETQVYSQSINLSSDAIRGLFGLPETVIDVGDVDNIRVITKYTVGNTNKSQSVEVGVEVYDALGAIIEARGSDIISVPVREPYAYKLAPDEKISVYVASGWLQRPKTSFSASDGVSDVIELSSIDDAFPSNWFWSLPAGAMIFMAIGVIAVYAFLYSVIHFGVIFTSNAIGGASKTRRIEYETDRASSRKVSEVEESPPGQDSEFGSK